jgi:FAD-dependent urate hydroxylase
MFESVEALDAHVRDSLADNRFYAKQSWVRPTSTPDGERIHDVLVVGAGQNGLALAYQLKLRGVRRIAVVDRQPRDRPGPWSSFARMPHLRTPKSIPGPDCGNPLLTFRTWFRSAYSAREYASFEFIPLRYWQEYLAWFRRVLEIDTVNQVEITDLEWEPAHRYFRARAGSAATFAARKVCLATGITATGRWTVPPELVGALPRELYCASWEEIPWPTLAGADVAVVGAGATGFDNAARALESGARSVTVIGRRPFPKKDVYVELWRGRNDGGVFPDEADSPPADQLDALLAHHVELPDADRRQLMAGLFRHGRSPANPDYLSRVRDVDRMTILEDWPVERIDHDPATGKARIRGNGEYRDFDRVVFATGPRGGIEHRPELRRVAARTLTWGDPPGELEQSTYPKLTAHYQLQPKAGVVAEELGHIYCLAELVHATVGLQSVQHVVPKVAAHIAATLYREQVPETIAFMSALLDS